MPLGPTGQSGALLVGEGSRGLPHWTGSLPPILTFSSLSRTVPQCLRSPKTPRAPPDLMQSSPGDVLARSGAVAGIHWGEYPTSPDHRVSLKGKEERGPQPSPPTLEETGRGQAMPPSLEEQEQSCLSPCAAPCPPSCPTCSRPPSPLPSAPHQVASPRSWDAVSPQPCPGFAAAQHKKCPHTRQPVLGNGFTPIPSCLISFIQTLFVFQQQLALPRLLSLPVLYSECIYNVCTIYINAAPSLQKVQVPKPP